MALTNLTEENKDGNEKIEKWRKKLRLSSKTGINVVHRYSNIRETLLRTTYNALVVKLTDILQVCDGYARFKSKHVRSGRRLIRESHSREK